MTLRVLSYCFFLSGASGLIYEVVWTRWLGLIFGNTTLATSAVLAAYMGGLALGSYVFGRALDRRAAWEGLRVYGWLEGGVGVYGLLTPALFPLIERLYVVVYRHLQPYPVAFNATRFVCGLLLLLLPTALMGGTLPALSKFVVSRAEETGNRVGFLYALNTFGAVAGTMLAGYALLPMVGLRASIFTAAVCNLAIALAVMLTYIRNEPSSKGCDTCKSENPQPITDNPPAGLHSTLASQAVLVAIGLSGFVALVYEVVWTRVLAMLIGSSVYAFTAMLTAFLIGLALGSAWCSRHLASRLVGTSTDAPQRRTHLLALFGCIEAGIGITAIALVPVFGAYPYLMLPLGAVAFFAAKLSQTFAANCVLALQLLVCTLTMIIPTTLMGATFPLAAALYANDRDDVSASVGNVYAMNTIGAILGAMAAAFVCIPLFGLQGSLRVATLLNLAIAAALWSVSRLTDNRQRRWALMLLAVGAAFVLFVPSWQKQVMTAGVYRYGLRYLQAYHRRDAQRRPRLVYYNEGLNCTVSVMRDSRHTWLAVNGKFDASTAPHDMDTQLMLGHLPMLLHAAASKEEEPLEVFIIGLGSGVTAASVAEHNVARIDCAELEPAVAEAARRFFGEVNHGIFDDSRFHLIVDDGRHQLLANARRYDVIISEPSSLWMSGIANLYTLEEYRLCRQKLKPRGLVCQWLQAYQLSPDDMKLLVRTFTTVFPHTTIWCSTIGDLLLIGSPEPLIIDFRRLSQRIASNQRIQTDLAAMDVRQPATLFTCFVLDEAGVRDYAATVELCEFARLHTDDWPHLEFSAPKTMYTSNRGLHYRTLVAHRHASLPPMRGFTDQDLRAPRLQQDMGQAYRHKEIQPEEGNRMTGSSERRR